MSPAADAPTARDTLWIAALAIGLPLLGMALMGVDANWDLRNYHLYNVHAWLAGRSQDVAPAMLQSWHNPLLDLPMYLLFTSGLPARATSLWLALPTMLSIACLLLLQRALSPTPPTRTSQAVLALLAMLGVASWSTLATSFNDAFVGGALLLSLWLAFGVENAGNRRWLLAGLVAGAMAGLKLTASFYCVALAFAALSSDGLRANLLRLAHLAAGGLLGVALTFGWWGLRLWRGTGNPFFPYFNNLFHSPLLPPYPFADERFRPDSFVDGVLAPVHLLSRSLRFAEAKMSDPRLLLGFACLLALLWLGRRNPPAEIGTRLRRLFVFFAVSFALWIFQYGIYRYAIVLEFLGSLALVLLLMRLPRWQPLLLVFALLAVGADTHRPKWERVEGMQPGAGMQALQLPRDALVVSADGEYPLAYMALALPDETPFLGLGTNIVRIDGCNNGLRRLADARLRAHPGPVWLLAAREQTDGQRHMLQDEYGLHAAGACRVYENQLGPVQLCPLERRPVAPHCPASAATTP